MTSTCYVKIPVNVELPQHFADVKMIGKREFRVVYIDNYQSYAEINYDVQVKKTYTSVFSGKPFVTPDAEYDTIRRTDAFKDLNDECKQFIMNLMHDYCYKVERSNDADDYYLKKYFQEDCTPVLLKEDNPSNIH